MNIVHIEDFFHPEAGYQVNVLSKYMVKMGHCVTIVTAELNRIPNSLTSFFGIENIEKKDDEFARKTGVKIIRLPIITFISGRAVFKNSIFNIVDSMKPDILYIHGNDTLTGIRFLTRLKKTNYTVIMDSHMLKVASVNKFSKFFKAIYFLFITPIIKRRNIIVIRTQDDDYVERYLGIPLKQCPYIPLGSDTLLFQPDNEIKRKFKDEHNINQNSFLVLYIGKLDEAKDGKLLANAFRREFNFGREIILVVVGNTVGEYGSEVEEIFSQSQNKIIRFATQKYLNMAKYFKIADLAVFPKQCSLSFYDAQACGLPVLLEDIEININRCSHGNGFVFKSGNIDDFREKIISISNMNMEDYNRMSQNSLTYIMDNYDYKNIVMRYLEIIEEEYKKFHRIRSS